jgi:hypothetical protein
MTTNNGPTLDRADAARASANGSTTSFFKPAIEAPSFLKAGIYGDAGTGKSYTASLIACGLAKRIGNAPALFLDTEGGSVWVKKMFDAAGVPFLVHRSRAYKDAKAAVAEAERIGGILIIDSITHFWEEIRDAYLKAKRERTRNPHARLELPDWNQIKPEWGKFTALFLNSQCHIILCGRGASVYEFVDRDDDPSKKDMITSGTRMAAEKGLGYEPSLLIEMAQKQTIAAGKRKTITRVATVLKDRSDVLDGQRFEDPTFESFLPHVEFLNIGNASSGYVAFDESRTSEGIFPTEGAGREAYSARRLVALDDTKDLLLKHIPGQSVAEKQRKTELFRKHFGCGWVEAEELASLEQLKAGYLCLKAELEPEAKAAPSAPVDEIPFLEPKESAAPAAAAAAMSDASAATVALAHAEANDAAAPEPAAPVSGLAADLEASVLATFVENVKHLHNPTRITALWKDYERPYRSMSAGGQAQMLLAKQQAIARCAIAKVAKPRVISGPGREAALASADAEAAREAAQ